MAKCGQKCEIYARVCGYHRPVANWNRGKKEEWKDRKTFGNNTMGKCPDRSKDEDINDRPVGVTSATIDFPSISSVVEAPTGELKEA